MKSLYLCCLNERSGQNLEEILTFVEAVAPEFSLSQAKSSVIIRFISSYKYRRSYRLQRLSHEA